MRIIPKLGQDTRLAPA